MSKEIKINLQKKIDHRDTDQYKRFMMKHKQPRRMRHVFFSGEVPTSYRIAMKEEVWRQAMKEELEAIERNSTWELVKLPEKCKSIVVKWIYKIKRNVSGEITRYKARFVAKGFIQVRGIDYEEVFSPVARAESIRIIIVMAAQFKWNLHHLDVKSERYKSIQEIYDETQAT